MQHMVSCAPSNSFQSVVSPGTLQGLTEPTSTTPPSQPAGAVPPTPVSHRVVCSPPHWPKYRLLSELPELLPGCRPLAAAMRRAARLVCVLGILGIQVGRN